MSKGRLRKEVSARFPRVTFLQGKVVNHASIYPQLSASVKSKQKQQCKYYLKGVSSPDTFRLTKPRFSVHLVTSYMCLQLAGTLLRAAETDESNQSQLGTRQGVVGEGDKVNFFEDRIPCRTLYIQNPPYSCISEKIGDCNKLFLTKLAIEIALLSFQWTKQSSC